MDVTPLSLSIETVGGVATRLIERNSTIPTRYSQIFSTAANFQTSVDIKVLQGERQFARDNKLIGNFKLNGIKRALRGVPQIEVTFDIDVNGILSVSARDLGTGKEQHITITATSNLSEEEIQRAVYEAANYETLDAERKEAVEVRNEAEVLTANVSQAMMSKAKKSLNKAQKNEIKTDLAALSKLLRRTKAETITVEQGHEIKAAKQKLEHSAAVLLNQQV